MNRDLFDEYSVCDVRGTMGAFDFIGDYICQECLEKLTQEIGDEQNERT